MTPNEIAKSIDPTKNVADQIRAALGLKEYRPTVHEMQTCMEQFNTRLSDECTCGGHELLPPERDVGIFHPYLWEK